MPTTELLLWHNDEFTDDYKIESEIKFSANSMWSYSPKKTKLQTKEGTKINCRSCTSNKGYNKEGMSFYLITIATMAALEI